MRIIKTLRLILLLGIMPITTVLSQTTPPYQLTWLTTNATTSTGNNYTLSAQINNQGAGASSGGVYALNPIPPSPAQVFVPTRPRAYLPLVRR